MWTGLKKEFRFEKVSKQSKNVCLLWQYAHEQGIIHRDLKPENILITKENEPKIGDFGLARDITVDTKSRKITYSGGAVIGTPQYMSPEQVRGEAKLEATSDVYSMGVCLYQVLTAKLPFEENALHVLFEKILYEEPELPSKINYEIHHDLDIILMKSIEKLPRNRYQTAKEFARDIERFLEGYPIKAKATPPHEILVKWCKRNKQMVVLFLLIFLVGTGYPLYFKWQTLQKTQKNVTHALEEYEIELYNLDNVSVQEKTFQEQKIQYLLNALSILDQILYLNPQNIKTEKEKVKIGKELIELACENEEFQLASFVAKDLGKLKHFTKADRNLLLSKIGEYQKKKFKKHQKQFQNWVARLKTEQLDQVEREDVIFEISRIREPEIFKRMKNLFQPIYKDYFLKETPTKTQRQFYETLVVMLGRQENPLAAPLLLQTLEKGVEALPQSPWRQKGSSKDKNDDLFGPRVEKF